MTLPEPGYLKWDGLKYVIEPIPTGPTGATGPAGATGATGPASETVVDGYFPGDSAGPYSGYYLLKSLTLEENTVNLITFTGTVTGPQCNPNAIFQVVYSVCYSEASSMDPTLVMSVLTYNFVYPMILAGVYFDLVYDTIGSGGVVNFVAQATVLGEGNVNYAISYKILSAPAQYQPVMPS